MIIVNYSYPQKTGKISFVNIQYSLRSQPFCASFGDFQEKVAINV